MKRITDITVLLSLLLVLLYADQLFSTSKEALILWFEKLVPSLFVSMVIIRILYKRNVFHCFSSKHLAHWLHMDKEGIPILLCAILLGFPSGASFIDQLCAEGVLDKNGAKRFIETCCFATSGFVIMTCGIVLFHSATIGYLLFFSQVITGLFLFWTQRKTYITVYESIQNQKESIMKQIPHAIIESGVSLYMIGGYLLFFMSLFSIISTIIPTAWSLPISIIAEFSSGVFLIQQLSASPFLHALYTCSLLGFGGFCVHMQIFSMSEHVPLTYRTFFIKRLLQAIISTLLFYILYSCYLSF